MTADIEADVVRRGGGYVDVFVRRARTPNRPGRSMYGQAFRLLARHRDGWWVEGKTVHLDILIPMSPHTHSTIWRLPASARQ